MIFDKTLSDKRTICFINFARPKPLFHPEKLQPRVLIQDDTRFTIVREYRINSRRLALPHRRHCVQTSVTSEEVESTRLEQGREDRDASIGSLVRVSTSSVFLQVSIQLNRKRFATLNHCIDSAS